MRFSFVLLALSSAACLRQTEYHCASNESCGASGQCESTGYCSVVDGNCSSGWRYGNAAGGLSGTCVGGGDMVVDAPPVADDAAVPPVDAPPAGCPGGYNPISGGNPGHVYRLFPAGNWNAQRTLCSSTSSSAYLAVPDDDAELLGLDTLAAANARYWLGITDSAVENTWRTVRGAVQTFLPWEPGAPDNAGPGEDCVEAVSATHKINDERCNTQLPAICECEMN